MIDRINRVLLWLFGLALVAVGVLGVQARTNALNIDVNQPGRIYQDAEDGVHGTPGLWWTLIIGGAVLIASAVLIWLRFQFIRRGGPGIGSQVISRTTVGTLEVDPAPVARAVASDLEALDGVHSSRVRILSMMPTADLVAQLDLQRGVDPVDIQVRAEEILERLRKVLGAEHTKAEIRLRMAQADIPRVV